MIKVDLNLVKSKRARVFPSRNTALHFLKLLGLFIIVLH